VPEVIRLDDPVVVVRVHRSSRARRFTLSLRHRHEARLTAPTYARDHETMAFLERHRDWLRDALDRAPNTRRVVPGATLPIDGRQVTLAMAPRRSRGCVLDGDTLLVPPDRATGPAVAAFLRVRAQAALLPAARRAAEALGRDIARVSFRDTRSRWGSCTARGDLMFSWRLAMAPAPVQLYVANHEAAHLVEMNHGPGFWRLVERLTPDWRAHRAWLRCHGPTLHQFVFADP
jgi:predicted metal-dependent hydrolase